MDVPAEPCTGLAWSWSSNGSVSGSPTGAARMAGGLQKVQAGTSNVKSYINKEQGFGVYFGPSLYWFFPATALGRVLGPSPSHQQQRGEAGWMPPGGAFSSAPGKPETTPCRKAAAPAQKTDLTRMSSPAHNMGFAAFPAPGRGGCSHRTPPCQAALLPKLEAERRRRIETSP